MITYTVYLYKLGIWKALNKIAILIILLLAQFSKKIVKAHDVQPCGYTEEVRNSVPVLKKLIIQLFVLIMEMLQCLKKQCYFWEVSK